MIIEVIAVRDIVANVFNQPAFTHHLGSAIRGFGDECQRNAPDNILHKHPEDFELWHIGQYNDQTGELIPFPIDQRKQLAVGANYRAN